MQERRARIDATKEMMASPAFFRHLASELERIGGVVDKIIYDPMTGRHTFNIHILWQDPIYDHRLEVINWHDPLNIEASVGLANQITDHEHGNR